MVNGIRLFIHWIPSAAVFELWLVNISKQYGAGLFCAELLALPLCLGERLERINACSGERCGCWGQLTEAAIGATGVNDDDVQASALALQLLLQVALALELLRRQTIIANLFKHLHRMVRATLNFCWDLDHIFSQHIMLECYDFIRQHDWFASNNKSNILSSGLYSWPFSVHSTTTYSVHNYSYGNNGHSTTSARVCWPVDQP